MTEFSEVVEERRDEIRLDKQVKEWSKQVKYILAENGYLKTAYNDGRVEIVYHRDYGNHIAGDTITEAEGLSYKEVRQRFITSEVDKGRY